MSNEQCVITCAISTLCAIRAARTQLLHTKAKIFNVSNKLNETENFKMSMKRKIFILP